MTMQNNLVHQHLLPTHTEEGGIRGGGGGGRRMVDSGGGGSSQSFPLACRNKCYINISCLQRRGGGGIRGWGRMVDLRGVELDNLFYDHAEEIGISTLAAYTHRRASEGGGGWWT